MTEEELSRLFNEIANTAQSAVFSDNTNANTTNANIPTPEPEINNLRFRSEYAAFNEHNAIEGMENMTELESTQRFSGAIWHNKIQEQEIVLAGVGGIGSYVLFLLSRMKPRQIYAYDPDNVEYVNLAGQLYSREDVGRPKVESVASMAHRYSDYYGISTFYDRFTETSPTRDIMICGFDNMAARKLFYSRWKAHVDSKASEEEKAKCLFIDGRLNAEEFQVLCITGNNPYAINKYESEWLFDDSQVEEAVCSYKQTTYMANMIGSVMVNLFTNFCANLCNPIVERDIPFISRYDGATMFFKTE